MHLQSLDRRDDDAPCCTAMLDANAWRRTVAECIHNDLTTRHDRNQESQGQEKPSTGTPTGMFSRASPVPGFLPSLMPGEHVPRRGHATSLCCISSVVAMEDGQCVSELRRSSDVFLHRTRHYFGTRIECITLAHSPVLASTRAPAPQHALPH